MFVCLSLLSWSEFKFMKCKCINVYEIILRLNAKSNLLLLLLQLILEKNKAATEVSPTFMTTRE